MSVEARTSLDPSIPNPTTNQPLSPQDEPAILPSEIRLFSRGISTEFDAISLKSDSITNPNESILFHSRPSTISIDGSTDSFHLFPFQTPTELLHLQPSLYNHFDLPSPASNPNTTANGHASRPPAIYTIKRIRIGDESRFIIFGTAFWGLQRWSSSVEITLEPGLLDETLNGEEGSHSSAGRERDRPAWRLNIGFKGPDQRAYY